MRRDFFRILLIGAVASLAGACGGGSIYGVQTTTTPPPPPSTGVPASIKLFVSSPQLSSDGNTASKGVTVTALVRDASNGVVSGATVTFSVDNNASINPQLATTSSDGLTTTVVTTGNDPTNRVLTVTAVATTASGAGGVTQTIVVTVVGTTIAVAGPNNAQFGAPGTFTVNLLDAGGNGIPNATVNVSSAAGNSVSPASFVTNGSGQGSFTYTPTTGATTDTVSATALGITASQTVAINTDSFGFTVPTPNQQINLGASQPVTIKWQVGGVNVPNGTVVNFATTRGTLSAASAMTNNGLATVNVSSTGSGVATIVANSSAGTQPQTSINVEFVAINPAKIAVQANPTVVATNSTSEVTATVRDANDNLVKGVQVAFSVTDSTGGTISSPLVTTNSQGVAKVIYNSTSTTSATNGVAIKATVNGTAITDTAFITVGGRAARIVLGTGNEIFEPSPTTYQFPYSVIVTDNNGAAASGTTVFLKVESVEFYKGQYVTNPSGSSPPFVTGSCNGATCTTNLAATCPNEDTNSNGVLDAAEDINLNGQLDPSNVATVPNSVVTDSNGTFQFNVTYPQDRGNWVKVRLTASATVTGSEATQSVDFVLPISQSDENNPPGFFSPYGQEGSTDNNGNGRIGCADAT